MWMFLLSCTTNPDRFSQDLADATCALLATCEKLNGAGYADEAECLVDMLDRAADLASCGEDFDPEEAEACVADWQSMSCTDYEDPSSHPACAVCPE